MAIQIGAKPDSGFDDPLGMLKDCHRRIERFLHILGWVANKASGRALSEEERQAVEAALQYFSRSGPLHSRDEEESLFPRMRAQGAGDVLEQIAGLESDHQKAALLHDEATSLYTRWLAQNQLTERDQARLKELADQLSAIYREHIRVEEQVVFPRAADVIPKSMLPDMGREFKSRREKA